MSSRVLFAVACGFAAALCNLAPQSGSPGGLMLSLVTPLPLFFAGLTQSWLAAVAAGLVATAVMLGYGFVSGAGMTTALVFLAATAAPVIVLVRQTLLARQDDDGLVWYPVDRLAWWLGGIGIAFGIAAIVMMETTPFRDTADQVFASLFAGADMGAEETESLREGFRRLIPPIFAASSVMLLVFNGVLAQRIAKSTGRAVRPDLPLSEMRLPVSAAIALAVLSLASAFLPGTLSMIGAVGGAVLSALFVLQGLAVAHWLIRNRTRGGATLAVFYMAALFMMFVMTPVLLLTLMLLGVADGFLDLRRRGSGSTGT